MFSYWQEVRRKYIIFLFCSKEEPSAAGAPSSTDKGPLRDRVKGIGFVATCSLVIVGKNGAKFDLGSLKTLDDKTAEANIRGDFQEKISRITN